MTNTICEKVLNVETATSYGQLRVQQTSQGYEVTGYRGYSKRGNLGKFRDITGTLTLPDGSMPPTRLRHGKKLKMRYENGRAKPITVRTGELQGLDRVAQYKVPNYESSAIFAWENSEEYRRLHRHIFL